VQNSQRPDRIVIGTKSKKVAAVLRELYEPFVHSGNPILIMDERSSEMTKYAANGFLATKISFMNELANLCELAGANIDSVRLGIGSDSRIGKKFLFAGVGYGGSCFPKDVKALVRTAKEYGRDLSILQAVDAVNKKQKSVLLTKLNRVYRNSLRGKRVAIWGLSYKPQTDDIREAPSLMMIDQLLAAGAEVRAHDPIAMSRIREVYGKKIGLFENAYDALTDADALLVVTEWNEFRNPDFSKMKKLMRKPVILDGRNIYDPKEMKEKGFEYYCIGR
jgi:UDPglucose 6-dehydrogenase